MANTVTVTRAAPSKGKEYVRLSYSRLPNQTFGPYHWPDAVKDLMVSALLPATDARNLVLDALTVGSVTRKTGE